MLVNLQYVLNLGTETLIPFFKTYINLPILLYVPFVIFVMLAITNSVNLTDGVDGLASSVAAVVSVFLTFVALAYNELEIAGYCAAVTGACLGFLIFNANPAKVFMGDTGSLLLGGAIAGAALMLEVPLVLVLAGGVFVLETLSYDCPLQLLR